MEQMAEQKPSPMMISAETLSPDTRGESLVHCRVLSTWRSMVLSHFQYISGEVRLKGSVAV